MFSSLQPHRPTLQQPHLQSSPQHQQVRSTSHQITQRPSIRPQSQIEAMPPSFQPPIHFSPPPTLPQWDPALCHPVFFTQTLRKPPFPFSDGGGGIVSPVAFGYVAEAYGVGKGSNGGAKL